jgi:hypothetical protein
MAILYVLIVVCSFMAYRLHTYATAPDPAEMKKALEAEQAGTLDVHPQTVVMNRLLDAYRQNARQIQGKLHWAQRALWLFLFESLALAGVLVVVSFV